ncbi:MAG: tRNA-binding protein [DPANN group archaeon]|nr:tRNA-binding protein [DPANN group archaeon]
MAEITWQDFEKIEIRAGIILAAEPNTGAKKPAYKLKIDFGPLGIKYSSAQITGLYSEKDLIGKQIVAVVNFPPKQVASVKSECLVLGVLDKQGIVLLRPERKVENGGRIA